MQKLSLPVSNQTSERQILENWFEKNLFPTGRIRNINTSSEQEIPCVIPVGELSTYRVALEGEAFTSPTRKVMTADVEWLHRFEEMTGGLAPSFLKADQEMGQAPVIKGPIKAAVLTSGGPAPGLNSVTHSIVKRLETKYPESQTYGVVDSFPGLANPAPTLLPLHSLDTEDWQREGGSRLGCVRGPKVDQDPTILDRIIRNLRKFDIDMLFVIGGDGSLTTAHMLAEKALSESDGLMAKPISVIGVPKTMDNDILWVWKSFGFRTAVAKAAGIIGDLHVEAQTTRRALVVELFGAEAGFVAANAALAAGCADLVLIPEVFKGKNQQQVQSIFAGYLKHLNGVIADSSVKKHAPHAVVVLAEGVGKCLEAAQIKLDGHKIEKDNFLKQFCEYIEAALKATQGAVRIAKGQPQYEIRSEAANPEDQIYCKRLGALAVDSALQGYTDMTVSEWLTEYVRVPLEMVIEGKKEIPLGGRFWRQVVESTGQPFFGHDL